MIDALLIFLFVSLFLYVLFGGADFGAGVLEFVLGADRQEEKRTVISHAIAPVWEANHIWLILAVVIVFMGFPQVYSDIATFLYIPVMSLLIGIVGRGASFVFRYYDEAPGEKTINTYSKVFALSSVWCALWLGVMAGAVGLGRIDPSAKTFNALYVTPWLNWMCLFCGLFCVALFGFLAASFLTGETSDVGLKKFFRKRAIQFSVAMIVIGALVFLSGALGDASFTDRFVTSPLSLVSFFCATLLLVPLRLSLSSSSKKTLFLSRIFGVTVIFFVLAGWFSSGYPVAIFYKFGALSYFDAAAPEPVQRALLIALVGGLVLVTPCLGYLFFLFKSGPRQKASRDS